MAITRADIKAGYLMILGREPESEAAYAAHGVYENIQMLRKALILSEEGRAAFSRILGQRGTSLQANYNVPSYCFIHLEKTGGTSVYSALKPLFGAGASSPPHLSRIDDLPLREIGRYDFLAGHFDYFSSTLIPRTFVKRFSIFRDPIDRLISFYRFHKAHSPETYSANPFVKLAIETTPLEFFTHQLVVSSPRLNNAYLRAFGSNLYDQVPAKESDSDLADALHCAQGRIHSLDSLGITERMTESIALIGCELSLQTPSVVPRLHTTDKFAEKSGVQIETISISASLQQALYALTYIDRKIYDLAYKQFELRLATLLVPTVSLP